MLEIVKLAHPITFDICLTVKSNVIHCSLVACHVNIKMGNDMHISKGLTIKSIKPLYN